MPIEGQRSAGRGGFDGAPAIAEGRVDPRWAWAPYKPDGESPWNLPLAGHLFRRAAFGADWRQLQEALADGPQRTIDRLLRPDARGDSFNRTHDKYEMSAAGDGSTEALRAWWLRRMIHTPHPLLEKMTLFWHHHFAVSNAKVQSALLMHNHVRLLRRHALGRFEPLLQAICRDPAVLLWLNAGANRKAQPSTDLARGIMEAYALGAGRCSEADVAEAARAFTGWFVLRKQLRFIPREHDSGVKKILGKEGHFKSEDVARIVLGQPAAAPFLVRKLYRWLISEVDEPSDELVAPLAGAFSKDYDVSQLVETMLRSNLFFSQAAYRRRIKSPVEFALGIVKGLEGDVSTTKLGQDLAALGQNLHHPPTLKGWAGGRRWINSATLLGRGNLGSALLAGSGRYGGKLDPLATAQKHGCSAPEPARAFLLDLFLQGDVEQRVRESLLAAFPPPGPQNGDNRSARLRQFAHAVVTLPEFHLA
jgi:hypothetical protein